MKKRKLLQKALTGGKNFRFPDFCLLAQAFGYRLDRISGRHHIFSHPEADRPLNLQNVAGQAKPYQVRQFLRDIEEYNLRFTDDL